MPTRRSQRLQRSHGSAVQGNGGIPRTQAESGPPNPAEGAESTTQTPVNVNVRTLTDSPTLNPIIAADSAGSGPGGRTPAARYGCSRGIIPTTQPSVAGPTGRKSIPTRNSGDVEDADEPAGTGTRLFPEFPTAEPRRGEFEFHGSHAGTNPA